MAEATHKAIRVNRFIAYKSINAFFQGVWGTAYVGLMTPLAPEIFSAGGIGFSILGKITDALSVYSSVFRDWEGLLDLRPGIKYQLMDQIDILWSINTEGTSMNFGTDISITPDWSVLLAYNTHQFLGNSLSFSTMYVFQP